MSNLDANNQVVPDLYIEWPDQTGVVQASVSDGFEHLKQDSQKAINITLGVIRSMAEKLSDSIESFERNVRPNEMEIEFSIKLELEGGAVFPMVAKTTTGGQFVIKFKWNLDEKPITPSIIVNENNP